MCEHLNGMPKFILPPKVKSLARKEDCGSCTWARPVPGGGLECHGAPPTCHILMIPNPLAPGQMRPQPLCVWPPVRPNVDYCRLWEARDSAPEPDRAA